MKTVLERTSEDRDIIADNPALGRALEKVAAKLRTEKTVWYPYSEVFGDSENAGDEAPPGGVRQGPHEEGV